MVLIIHKKLLLERRGQGIFSSTVTFCSAHFPEECFSSLASHLCFCEGSEDHGPEHLSRSEAPAFIGVSVPNQPVATLSEEAGEDGWSGSENPSSLLVFWKAVDVYSASR